MKLRAIKFIEEVLKDAADAETFRNDTMERMRDFCHSNRIGERIEDCLVETIENAKESLPSEKYAEYEKLMEVYKEVGSPTHIEDIAYDAWYEFRNLDWKF